MGALLWMEGSKQVLHTNSSNSRVCKRDPTKSLRRKVSLQWAFSLVVQMSVPHISLCVGCQMAQLLTRVPAHTTPGRQWSWLRTLSLCHPRGRPEFPAPALTLAQPQPRQVFGDWTTAGSLHSGSLLLTVFLCLHIKTTTTNVFWNPCMFLYYVISMNFLEAHSKLGFQCSFLFHFPQTLWSALVQHHKILGQHIWCMLYGECIWHSDQCLRFVQKISYQSFAVGWMPCFSGYLYLRVFQMLT